MSARTAVVVGNPKPGSRTLAAATYVARELTGGDPDLAVDLATLGAALLDWKDPTVAGLVDEVGAADLVVVASPTYKATYTGLRGVAVPLMLGAGPAHALAPELHLRPLLSELGASVPAPALYVLDHQYDQPEAYDDWLAQARPVVHALLATRTGARP